MAVEQLVDGGKVTTTGSPGARWSGWRLQFRLGAARPGVDVITLGATLAHVDEYSAYANASLFSAALAGGWSS